MNKRSAARTQKQFDQIVAIDWSGRIDVAGQRRHIWAAAWSPAGVTLEAGRTRDQICDWLMEQAGHTPRTVVGMDFAFSYPAWFLREQGAGTALQFWKLVAAGQGEAWLHRECGDARFWGKPKKKPLEFCGEYGHRMLRFTDVETKCVAEITEAARAKRVSGIAPKSPFQIGGAGAVGTGSLRGIPYLLRLREGGYSIWPFDAPKLPTVLEIYPRLLTGPVNKGSADARRAYLTSKRRDDARYRNLTGNVSAKAESSEDAFDALVSVMEMAARQDELLALKPAANAQQRLEGCIWAPAGSTAGR